MLEVRRPSIAAVAFAWCGGALFVLSLVYFLYCYLVRFGATAAPDLPFWSPLLVNVALFSGFALHHSIAARNAVKRRLHRVFHPALERSAYTWIASVLFILVCAWWQPVPGSLYRLSGPAAVPGYLVQALGILLTIRSSARLDMLDLAGIRPVLDARRDRAPAHVPLETRGMYRFVRHPLYFAWILFVFGAPAMTMTRVVFAAVSTVYLAIAIPFEERSLVSTFGADYRAYQQQVRWRLIPGVY